MSELALVCCRCDQGIRRNEAYDRHVHDRASAAPAVNYTHRECPRR